MRRAPICASRRTRRTTRRQRRPAASGGRASNSSAGTSTCWSTRAPWPLLSRNSCAAWASLKLLQAIPEAWFLAREGERIVGLSTLERVTGATHVAECGHTAVHPAYRGRGIAPALKLHAIAYARLHASRCIQTNRNASNEQMLQVNAAVG
jgi:GNAT superfamily N-acetyltransferase